MVNYLVRPYRVVFEVANSLTANISGFWAAKQLKTHSSCPWCGGRVVKGADSSSFSFHFTLWGGLHTFRKPLPYNMHLFNLRIVNHILIKIRYVESST